MKIDGTLLQLTEAREHLDNLIEQLRNGELTADDDASLEVEIDHLLDHICFAWNGRDISIAEYVDLSDEDFGHLWNTVPNSRGSRTLER